MEDLTDRKGQTDQKDRWLERESYLANRLHTLISLLPSGMVVLDAQGFVQECNPVAIEFLGKPLIRQPWSDVISRNFAPRVDDGHEVSLKDGRRVSIATRSLYPEEGQLILITDLSDTRALQARMNRETRLSEMGTMIAHLAHQVRTPLATAMLYTKHLLNPSLDHVKLPQYASQILLSLDKLEQQVRDLLLFARGGNDIVKPIELSVFLKKVVEGIQVQIDIEQVQLTVDNQIGELMFAANSDALQGALHNLLLNAMQASEDCNELQITLRARLNEPGYLTLSVIDNGPGMPPGIVEKAKDAFFTTRAKGTGLGLAVVEAVAHSHRGYVSIHSIPNHSTEVRLFIPIHLKETLNERRYT